MTLSNSVAAVSLIWFDESGHISLYTSDVQTDDPPLSDKSQYALRAILNATHCVSDNAWAFTKAASA